jgi:hypothetical protein
MLGPMILFCLGGDWALDDIVRLNQARLDDLSAVRVTFVVKDNEAPAKGETGFVDGKTRTAQHGLSDHYTVTWTRVGDAEKLVVVNHRKQLRAGHAHQDTDMISNSPRAGYRRVVAYDLQLAKQLARDNPGTLGAYCGAYKKVPNLSPIVPLNYLLFTFAHPTADGKSIEFLNLRELVRLSEVKTIAARPKESPDGCHVLELEEQTRSFGRVKRTINVDSNHSFNVRKVSASGAVTECLSYFALADGSYFPKVVSAKVKIGDQEYVRECHVTDCVLNPAGAESACDLHFPQWCRVLDVDDGKIHLWGDHGPLKTFANYVEYRRWFDAIALQNAQDRFERLLTNGNGSNHSFWLLIGVAALVAACAFFVVRRRWQTTHRGMEAESQ